MNVIVVGCGRVGARVATELAALEHSVVVIDPRRSAFTRLPPTFTGKAITGSGTEMDVLRAAGAETADMLMALTEGDNRNALAAQLAKHEFNVPRVIAKINDPIRADTYRTLGIETICRTVILADALVMSASSGAEATHGMTQAPTAEPRRDHGPAAPAGA